MINPKNKLILFYKDAANPVQEFSREVADYGRDDYTLTFKSGDILYIGYEKPINCIYVELSQVSTNTGNLSMTKTISTGDTPVEEFDDDTRNFKRSGFIQWKRSTNSNEHVASTPEVGMPEAFYFKLETTADTEEIIIKGLNIVFSDDQDLEKIVPCISDVEFLQGKQSHILHHVAARDEILQRYRNKDFKTYSLTGQSFEQLIPWDFLDIQEVRQGAAYLAASNVFFNLSDAPDDMWHQKSLFYRAKYEEQIELSRASFDFDDDGHAEIDETQRLAKDKVMSR